MGSPVFSPYKNKMTREESEYVGFRSALSADRGRPS